MREDDSNWFSRWEEELPSPEELMPLSQTLITPDLAIAFDITNTKNPQQQQKQQFSHPPPQPSSNPFPSPGNPTSAEFADSAELAGGGEEPARTLKRPRLVWTPQLHKRFVDAVAHLGIKNAVPKTIMQLMSVDGLTRENVASHLQKYRLYLKRMQGLSTGAAASTDSSSDRLFASSPVPPHFLHPGTVVRPNSDQFLPFVAVPPHQQQYHGQLGHFGSPPNGGQFHHPFVAARQSQSMGVSPGGYAEDMESANGSGGGRKVLTLFPTRDDSN